MPVESHKFIFSLQKIGGSPMILENSWYSDWFIVGCQYFQHQLENIHTIRINSRGI